MRVLVAVSIALLSLGGCHSMHAAAIDVPSGSAQLAWAVAAVESAARANGLDPVPPEQDATGAWWEPHVVRAFVSTSRVSSFALAVWVELDPAGPIVRLQQYYPGLAEPPEFGAVLRQLEVALVRLTPGARVRLGAEAFTTRASAGGR